MDFLKKIFGNNVSGSANSNQQNFVVDETGNAKEAGSFHDDPVVKSAPAPAAVSVPVNPAPVTVTAAAPIIAPTSAAETTVKSEGEYVGDTSAFDDLMKQAESSVEARVLEQPVLDPEFQKAKDELESEGDIEIFPAE